MRETQECLVGGLFLWDNRAKEGELMGLHIHHLCMNFLGSIFLVHVFLGLIWVNIFYKFLTTVVIDNCSKLIFCQYLLFGRKCFFITGTELGGRRRVFLKIVDVLIKGNFWFLTILK